MKAKILDARRLVKGPPRGHKTMMKRKRVERVDPRGISKVSRQNGILRKKGSLGLLGWGKKESGNRFWKRGRGLFTSQRGVGGGGGESKRRRANTFVGQRAEGSYRGGVAYQGRRARTSAGRGLSWTQEICHGSLSSRRGVQNTR